MSILDVILNLKMAKNYLPMGTDARVLALDARYPWVDLGKS